MKKQIALALAVLMLALTLAACGGDTSPTPGGNNDPTPQQNESPASAPDNGGNDTPTTPPSQSGTYTLTFIGNGGLVYDGSTEAETLIVEYTPGEPLTIPTATKNAGYEFIGWCTDAELTTFLPQFAEITSDLTLYAYWAPAP